MWFYTHAHAHTGVCILMRGKIEKAGTGKEREKMTKQTNVSIDVCG